MADGQIITLLRISDFFGVLDPCIIVISRLRVLRHDRYLLAFSTE